MNTATVVDALTKLVAALQIAKQFGLDVREVSNAIERAHAEGRELTDDEVKFFVDSARAAVERL